MSRCPIEVRVQGADFDLTQETDAMTEGRADIGALVAFVGLCRDEGGRLAALELEHYPGMAEAEILRVAEAAARRWALKGVRIIHRFGLIAPGARIMLAACASPHRADAFAAADFLMDYLKSRAPFWKKEHLLAGGAQGWVSAKDSDAAALARWETTV